MIMTRKNTVLSLLLLLAAVLSGWSIFLSKQSQPQSVSMVNNRPDVMMEEVKATIMNKEGKPALQIESPKLLHYADNDRTELTKPHVVIHRHSPEPWHINSNFANMKQGLNEITFWDDVVIHHSADTANPVTTLHTATLTVFPNQQLVKTEDPVVMTQPATTIRAVGMLANWDEGTVKLLSQAREEYVPNS
jgi:lipopolysaccharide export system protein LptC